MGISGVSAASPSSMLAAQATEQKALQLRDDITVAVINDIQDQQQAMAEALIDMMETGQVDIYA